MDRRFIAILVVIIVAMGGYIIFSKKSDDKGTNSSSTVSATNHVMGQNSKKVVLVEYGDYQCPACGAYYPIVKQLTDTYQQEIQFQFRNFPLDSIHPNARAGARAAEAAGKQNKYWEMHDKLYESQQTWASMDAASVKVVFEGYAKDLSLDIAKFQTDFASKEANDAINADIAEGQKIGANSTPTFVLNGKKIEENPRSIDDFKKLIDDEIAKQNPTKTNP